MSYFVLPILLVSLIAYFITSVGKVLLSIFFIILFFFPTRPIE